MTFSIRSIVSVWLASLGLVLATQTQAQVVVYSVEFEHKDGFNVEFFHGGYVVAPLLGGAGTFLLTAFDGGRRVLDTSPGSGNYFLAKNGDKRYNVVAATVGTGSTGPGGSYIAYGEVNRTLFLQTPTSKLRLRIAGTLTGKSVAADDEGGEVKFDGSVGTANFSSLKMALDDTLTKDYNKRGLSVEEAAAEVTRMLRWKGYSEAAPETPTNPENPGTPNPNPNPINPGTGGDGALDFTN
jgi:hypothetical protein